MSLCSNKIDVDPVRSRIMKAVGQKNTRPEMIVRRILHALGYRFRLHRRDLPGSPDIVLPKHRSALCVQGFLCYLQPVSNKPTTPKTRQEYWLPKFEANIERDRRKIKELEALGWRAAIIWECEAQNDDFIRKKLIALLVE